ncbi:hypothetical protein ON010_g16351 [Phytophthora cinnamomi]|nr:hypothetical protein ON010_g16351 [Phytophthora cinnamomi]
MAAFPSLVPGVFDGEDDSDDEYFRLFVLPTILAVTKRKHGGSQPGKRADKERKRAKWGELLMANYFGENPTYDERTRPRFRSA